MLRKNKKFEKKKRIESEEDQKISILKSEEYLSNLKIDLKRN